MPELPEVETIRRDLEREVVGKRIKTVEVTGTAHRSAGTTKKQFIAPARGRQDHAASSGAGKYLVLKLDTGDAARRSTCGMSGQLLRAQAKDAVAKHTHVVDHLHPGRAAALRRPAHVRRDVRHRARRADRGGARARRPRHRSRRRADLVDDVRRAAARAARRS